MKRSFGIACALFYLFPATAAALDDAVVDLPFLFSSRGEESFTPLESPSMDVEAPGMVQGSIERENSLTHLDAEPCAIVNSVNVISGEFMDAQTDAVIPCAEPLVVQRYYCSSDQTVGSLCDGWNLNHYGMIEKGKELTTQGSIKKYLATVLEGPGSLYHYEGKEKDKYKMSPKTYQKGVTNSGSGAISGRTNLKNNKLTYDRDEKTCCLQKGSGTELTFMRRSKHSDKWDLYEEKKASGNLIVYDYDKQYRLQKVKTQNKNRVDLSEVRLGINKVSSKVEQMFLIKNKTVLACYTFEKLRGKDGKSGYYLTHASSSQHPDESYTYETRDEDAPVRITKRQRPEGRCDTIQYYTKGKNDLGGLVVDIKSSQDPRANRVMIQKAPIGPDSTPIMKNKYVYHLNVDKYKIGGHKHYDVIDGRTDVYDAKCHLTVYYFNTDHRLTSIAKHTGEGTSTQLYSLERFFWGSSDGPNASNLLTRAIETKEGWKQFVKSYAYDSRGNILSETITGNLSGWNTRPPLVNGEGKPIENGCEGAFKAFTYSQDGKNLLLSIGEEANEERFSYVPGTDLLASKLYKLACWTYRREFYEYDENAVLIKEIHDDGNTSEPYNLAGVHERHIKYITPSKAEPSGLPEVIEEKYLDMESGQEKLLRKTVNSFNQEGRLTCQETYDSEGAYSHCLRWEYDKFGNVTKEIDALGNITVRKYDGNCNLIYEQGPNPDYHTELTYDYSNRLLKREVVCADGHRLANTYRYDVLNKIASSDIYGNETKYAYDEFGRIVKTVLPPVADAHGDWNNRPDQICHSKTYDVLNRPDRATDPNGGTTTTLYTIRNKPYQIVYPDGSEERNEYYLRGTLKKSTAKNGSCTLYTYDHQNNPIKKEFYSRTGELLSTTTAAYSGYHLLSETDAMGNVKQFQYDGAGRLIETRQGALRTTTAYDTLGRDCRTCEYYGPNDGDYIAKVKKHDVMDRVVEEWSEDSAGRILSRHEYSYDVEGHRIESVSYSQAGRAVTRTKYNSYGQPYEVVDPEGQVTRTVYKYDYRNEFGQTVPYNETHDPQGNITVTIQDALGRVACVMHKNSLGQTTQKKQNSYDANGNRTRLTETVFTPGKPERQVVTAWSYDNCNRLVSAVEAVGTPEQKQTSFIYNAYGQKECVVKPDGVSLWYEYDDMGRMAAVKASDNSINYRYAYDPNGNVTKVEDLINGIAGLREYDGNNRPVKEVLANGLTVSYTYDGLSRPLEITLPDGTSVSYVYDADKLKDVIRCGPSGEQLYSHTYSGYDEAGNLLESQLIKNAGQASFTHDLLGRPLTLVFPQWQETISSYDKVGNILRREVFDGRQNLPYQYAYDDLYQLIHEEGAASHDYVCDSLYNRVMKDSDENAVNALNQLLDDGEVHYTYDPNGNVTGRTSKNSSEEYFYDALDRLISFSSGQRRVQYLYDDQNRRIAKTLFAWDMESNAWVEKERSSFLYFGQNEVGTVDAGGIMREFRVLGSGKGAEIGAAVAIELDGQLYAPLHDHNGNVVALIDSESGREVETYRYTAFGEEEVLDSSGVPIEAARNPWRFSSKRVDPETGLIYFGRRYYNPATSRWLTPDPIAQEGGPNLYAYVLNAPLTHIDLYGLAGVNSVSLGFGGQFNWGDLIHQGFYQLGSLMRAPGRIIEYIGRNWVPIPFARDIIEVTGRFLAGRNMNDYVPHYKKHSDFFLTANAPKVNPRVRTVIVNGVGVSKKEFLKRMGTRSEQLNTPVYGVYNSTHGLIYDFMECAWQLLGGSTGSTEVMQGAMNYLTNAIGGIDGGGEINIEAHSQGGIITNSLTKSMPLEERKKLINVYTYGTGKIVDEKDFRHVRNYISYLEPVTPIANLITLGMAIVKPRPDIIFLEPKGCPIFQHAYAGNTYKGAMVEVARDLKDKLSGL